MAGSICSAGGAPQACRAGVLLLVLVLFFLGFRDLLSARTTLMPEVNAKTTLSLGTVALNCQRRQPSLVMDSTPVKPRSLAHSSGKLGVVQVSGAFRIIHCRGAHVTAVVLTSPPMMPRGLSGLRRLIMRPPAAWRMPEIRFQ